MSSRSSRARAGHDLKGKGQRSSSSGPWQAKEGEGEGEGRYVCTYDTYVPLEPLAAADHISMLHRRWSPVLPSTESKEGAMLAAGWSEARELARALVV